MTTPSSDSAGTAAPTPAPLVAGVTTGDTVTDPAVLSALQPSPQAPAGATGAAADPTTTTAPFHPNRPDLNPAVRTAFDPSYPAPALYGFPELESSGVADTYRALHAEGASWEDLAARSFWDSPQLAAFCRANGKPGDATAPPVNSANQLLDGSKRTT